MIEKSKFFEPLAVAIAAGYTIRAAAEQAKCSHSHAYRICSGDSFQARVAQVRSEITQGIVGQLVASSAKAVEVLHELLDNSEASIRLNAAKSILDRLLPLSEHLELRKRLDTLESSKLRIAK